MHPLAFLVQLTSRPSASHDWPTPWLHSAGGAGHWQDALG
jgi:hypothetical protein